jgi:hypothetical protein
MAKLKAWATTMPTGAAAYLLASSVAWTYACVIAAEQARAHFAVA